MRIETIQNMSRKALNKEIRTTVARICELEDKWFPRGTCTPINRYYEKLDMLNEERERRRASRAFAYASIEQARFDLADAQVELESRWGRLVEFSPLG